MCVRQLTCFYFNHFLDDFFLFFVRLRLLFTRRTYRKCRVSTSVLLVDGGVLRVRRTHFNDVLSNYQNVN